ncbi:MAG: hypothetical protein H6821_05645 [Planctomycetaceae bacterium]|nr:hypothetical protein [Planctomycetaceae bacterium]MCB9940196.1 hypothetical protein [Planctomycetaceae bacterium]
MTATRSVAFIFLIALAFGLVTYWRVSAERAKARKATLEYGNAIPIVMNEWSGAPDFDKLGNELLALPTKDVDPRLVEMTHAIAKNTLRFHREINRPLSYDFMEMLNDTLQVFTGGMREVVERDRRELDEMTQFHQKLLSDWEDLGTLRAVLQEEYDIEFD